MYSTVCKNTTQNKEPGLAGNLATARTPETAGTPAAVAAGKKARAGTPTKPGTPAIAGRTSTVRTSGSKGS